MRLPKNLLSPGTYAKPRIFLCETDKTKICQLETTNTKGSFKFNSYSELSFDVSRIYNDVITGEIKTNPFYDKIESPRLIYLENFAYFELQGPELESDGIQEDKSCTAYSLEYTLSTKYLDDFNVNTGKVDSLEVLNAEDPTKIKPITLYNQNNTNLSLLHLALEKAYGWTIGHVDSSLETLSRQFEIDRMSIYDFLMNEVCQKFNCYIVFDTINNTINIYAESLTSKFIGDGSTKTFTVSPPFAQIGTVSVDGYKTTRWSYDSSTGLLTLEDAPEDGAHVEVVDGALSEWETDVFVTFDNLAQNININYDSDAIKTVLTVTYGEDLSIRETNMGLPYMTDISYFYTVDWMGRDLYDAYTKYLQMCNSNQSAYTNNTKEMLEISEHINFEEHRLSLDYSVANSVNSTTVGTYYVRGGTSPNYYYTEVSLPDDYIAGTTYYSTSTANLDETKVSNLYTVLKKYFNNDSDWQTEMDKLNGSFDFMETNKLGSLKSTLFGVTENRTKNTVVDAAITDFLDEMWQQIGRTPLKSLYLETYKRIQTTNMNAEPDKDGNGGGNWSNPDHPNYPLYYPVTLYISTIENAIKIRDNAINTYQAQYDGLRKSNLTISSNLAMDVFFKKIYTEKGYTEDNAKKEAKKLMIRLSSFLREDELHLDDIVETSQTSVSESFQLKQDAMESGRIELQKLCEPQLQFSMTMANIYALPEFEPIIDQFQLGNVIKVGLRSDYIKQSRLLQVDLDFDDFSNFSCEFGDLTALRTQSDIHADLLSKAVSAGKSVATNSSYWTKGADRVTDIDLRLQEGLLNSIEALKSIDGTQNAYMDKYGIHLEAVNQDTGEISDKRVWMVNNQIVFTDDGFKTSKAALGEFKIGETTHYGLLAQAVLAGYIEGSQMVGGTIKIGLQSDGSYAFEVHEDGSVTMHGGGGSGVAGEEDFNKLVERVEKIDESKMYRVEIVSDGPTIISTAEDKVKMACKVYSWDVDVTDSLDDSLFCWKRISDDIDKDSWWNTMSEHQGTKSIEIDADDVVGNSSFICEVDLPGLEEE